MDYEEHLSILNMYFSINEKARGWPSASKIEAGILSKFEPNLDHPGEMSKGIQIKTIRNLNLDHLGGKC